MQALYQIESSIFIDSIEKKNVFCPWYDQNILDNQFLY